MPAIPVIPFPLVAGRLQRLWRPLEANPHQALFAQSRGGKSHLIRHGILPVVPYDRAVVFDVKPGGDRTWDGWGNDVRDLPPGFGPGDNGWARYRLLVHDQDQTRRVLEQIAAEGEVIVIIDDARRITDSRAPGLGLGNVVDHLLLEGAAIGVSVILGANSTAWATTALKDQAATIWIGHTRTKDQRDNFADLAGLPKELRAELDHISPRHWLYTDYAGEELMLARTTAPAAP